MDTVHLMAFLVIFGLVAYVILDGFDLGTGIIFPFVKQENRGKMMDSIAPFWDGNETWLIYAGGLLFAAFPVAYWVTLSALYIPAFIMLFFLALRGVAFEFRLKSESIKDKKTWENIFFIGSLGAGFFQGVILGAAVSGMKIENNQFAGNPLDFITPLSIACGLAVVVAYGILGTSWQVYKMPQEHNETLAKIMQKLLIVMLAIFVIAVPLLHYQRPDITSFIVSHKIRMLFCVILSIAELGVFYILLKKHFINTIYHFILTVFLFAIPLVTVLVALYPYAVPFTHTVHDIANTPQALHFVLIVTLCVLPLILCYTAFAYYQFKGKNSESYYSK